MTAHTCLQGVYKQSSQAVVPGKKQPWTSCLMPLQRYRSAGLFSDGISCSWFPFAKEGMGKEEMGYCLHAASVNSGKCWGEFPAGVRPTALDVSRSALKNANLSIFGSHAVSLWFYRCDRFSAESQLLSLSCFMHQILNQGRITDDWVKPWLC